MLAYILSYNLLPFLYTCFFYIFENFVYPDTLFFSTLIWLFLYIFRLLTFAFLLLSILIVFYYSFWFWRSMSFSGPCAIKLNQSINQSEHVRVAWCQDLSLSPSFRCKISSRAFGATKLTSRPLAMTNGHPGDHRKQEIPQRGKGQRAEGNAGRGKMQWRIVYPN